MVDDTYRGDDRDADTARRRAESGDHPSLDTVFEVLAAAPRRRVLERVLSAEGPVPLEDAVSELRSREAAAADASSTRKKRRVSLHHVHLPKLEEADMVVYDRRRRTIERGPNATVARQYLSIAKESPVE